MSKLLTVNIFLSLQIQICSDEMEYKTSTLGEVCVFFSGSGFPKKYQGNKEGEYPFYKVSDISRTIQQGNTILNRAENYVNSDVIQAIKGNILTENTVVFAKI